MKKTVFLYEDKIDEYDLAVSEISETMLKGDMEAAINIIEEAIEKYPKDIELVLKLVIALKNQQKYVDAGKTLIELSKRCSEVTIEQYRDVIVYLMSQIDDVLNNKTEYDNESCVVLNKKIIDYYLTIPFKDIPEDMEEPIRMIANSIVRYFPYMDMLEEYKSLSPEIHFDEQRGMYYVSYYGKRLYYPGDDIEFVDEIYRSMRVEQMESSPCIYTTDEFCVEDGDTVLDVGAVDGNFVLDHIEFCKKAYLFEASDEWKASLEATLHKWSDRVEIINKLVGNETSDKMVRIDDIVGEEQVDFLKIDAGGLELEVLEGARETLVRNENIKIAICTYHNADDAEILGEYLTKLGFTIECSKRYMLFPDSPQKPPYFRKGLIRATRKK